MTLHDRLCADGLLRTGRPVVVLYSGGRDSTCLLDLAVRIAGAGAVSALHVNYGLRDRADIDERHCAQLCDALGVTLAITRPRRPAPSATRSGGNLQAWARDARYGAAAQIALERRADVAAGHTATDQVETILYRLASSPSRRALLGMRAREGSLIRPLLAFSRAHTAEYCRSRGLSWCEDESNATGAYARGRVRAGLVPALREIHPAAEKNVLALAAVLRDEAEVLDALVDGALDGRDEIALAVLRELPIALRRLVVQRLADRAAGGLAPGAARRAEEVTALGDQGTSELYLGNGVSAVARYGVVRFGRPSPSETETAPEPVRLPIPGSVAFAGHEIRCELGPPSRAAGVLDREALGPDLLVRSWRPGDRMSPLGLRGSKSLQDLFTSRRVPRYERGRVAVIETAGEIAWIAGVATSERFKVTDATRLAVHLSVRETRPGRDVARSATLTKSRRAQPADAGAARHGEAGC